MTSPTVFISYSHDSQEHADRVLALVDRLVSEGIDCVLDQYESSPPEGWTRWMDRHIRESDFVIMVCTEAYYRRVIGHEEPGKGLGVRWEGNLIYQHLYDAETLNVRFVPALLESGKPEHIPDPLRGASYYFVDTDGGYEGLYRRLTDQPLTEKPVLSKLRTLSARKRQQNFSKTPAAVQGSDRVSLARLPSTPPELFGREAELAALDAAWDSAATNVVSLVAWGGAGKTALVNRWLLQMGQDEYRGALRVYGWSFYSQGAAEGRQASADLFIDAALRWFGDPSPDEGSPWDKGERLAHLVGRQRTLLVLDGLEPLQHPPGESVQVGRLKDPGLQSLLRALARHNPGLCVVSTRLGVDDIKEFDGTTAEHVDLDDLSDEAGAEFLSHLGVKGRPNEVRDAVNEFGGHALALRLLGQYLATVYDGDVRQRDRIPALTGEPTQGAHARRVMASYEEWFEGKPEIEFLRIIGLFDRPVMRGALDALLAEPAIEGLTARLVGLPEDRWRFALAGLRRAGMLAEPDADAPGELDTHPLVREHFGEKLRTGNPKGWTEAHDRLYEFYKDQAPEFPDTIEEMAPLYAAVAHGCQAGRHQQILFDVYWARILREDEFFSRRKLGALGADLVALSGFFDDPWLRPVAGLTEDVRAFVLNHAGHLLQALGRLAEGAQPMQAGLEADIAREDWDNAARAAENLSGLYLTLGDLSQAVVYAQRGVEVADKSGDPFERMTTRTAMADVLHRDGRLVEAEALFAEAEVMQKERQPQYPLHYSFRGYQYCDLLLGQGRYGEVQERASRAIEIARRNRRLFDVALDHLSLGRAHLMQALDEDSGDLSSAADHLDQAVDGLRQAGTQDHVPRGLVARAELHRATGEFPAAERDLEEALAIAERSGMGLHRADAHLEYARLYLATGDEDRARASLAAARGMIEEMGYHRRDLELAQLERVV